MDEKTRNNYNRFLTEKLVELFNMSTEDARTAVKESAIQKLMKEDPEFVDTTPLEYWAVEIYKERNEPKLDEIFKTYY